MAMNMLQEWLRSQEHVAGGGRRSGLSNIRWSKPQEGWVKINVDAACYNHLEYIGVGCVVRDHEGHFLRARSAKIRGGWQAREAEALSLKETLLWIREWRTTRCMFELDAKLVVEALRSNGGSSNFHTIIDDCVEILKHFQEVLVVFEHRSANKVAHMLAQAAYSMTESREWLGTAPEFILCNLISEQD